MINAIEMEKNQFKLFDETFEIFEEATNKARILYEEKGYDIVVDVNVDGKFILWYRN